MLESSIASFKAAQQLDPNAPIHHALTHGYMRLADLARRMGDEKAAAEAARQVEALRPDR
jgi:hypothetical protein